MIKLIPMTEGKMKIRAGVVGAGTYGESLIQAFYSVHRSDEIDFVAVADINQAAVDKMKKLYGMRGYTRYMEMFDREDLDAVAVVTPDYLHREIAVEAARRKIHILVQKPLATDEQEGRDMIMAAEENNILLYVDFHKRFDPAHIQLRQAVRSGKLGEIEYGYVCMEDVILVPSVWFKNWARYSSPAWFLGIHFYDLLYWILGMAPVRVYASGIKKKLASMNIETYDSLQAKFEYSSGASITVDSSWILPNSFPSLVNQQIRLVGSEGIQEVDSQDRGIAACYESEPSGFVLNPFAKILDEKPFAGIIPSGYTIESMLFFLKLVRMIKEGKTGIKDLEGYYPSGKEALVSTIICAAVHDSARLGKITEIRY
jgi:predicted dehydrogenase